MRRIWNRPPLPVYSLSTQDPGGQPNMNICTYVSAISLKPKLLAIGLYHGTKTLANAQTDSPAILQLLTIEQAHLVRKLGKKSGHQHDKLKNIATTREAATGLAVLPECAGWMRLDWVDFYQPPKGDHVLGIGQVSKSKNLSTKKILTTHILQEKGIISA